MPEAEIVRLGTVAKVRSGYAFKSEDMGTTGLSIIKIKNVTPPTVDIADCERVSGDIIASIPNVERFELKEGDTLIAMTGATVGKVGKFPRTTERFFLNQRVGKVYLTSPSEADYLYIYYILSQETFVRQMFGIADGSAQANISGTQIENLEIPLPSLAEQKVIATALGSLDNKIEINRQINTTLEAMALALFKSWFVDFDPVRVRAEGREPVGMDATTAALFPDSFEDSSIGLIPKEWRLAGLDESAEFLNGLAMQKYPPGTAESLPVIKIAQLRDENTANADRASTEIPQAYIVRDGDLLFSWSGSLAVVLWSGGTGALNQHLFKVTPKNVPKWYSWLWLLHHLPNFQRIAADKATTMGHIQRGHLSEAKVLIPDAPLLAAMDRVFGPLMESILASKAQSQTLAMCRDNLLPKLLSGELQLGNANTLPSENAAKNKVQRESMKSEKIDQ